MKVKLDKNTTKEQLLDYIDKLSKHNGFDYARYLGVYNGYDIYQPFFHNEEAVYGYPVLLHVRGNTIRSSKNLDEVFEILNYFFPS